MVKVKLDEIAEQLDLISDSMIIVLHKKTGEVLTSTEEYMDYAKDDGYNPEDFSDWEQEEISVAKDIIQNPQDYIPLPGKSDVDDYDIMRSFCRSLTDEKLQDELLSVTSGEGSFSNFDRLITSRGIREDWYKYKNEAYKNIVMNWCKENKLEYF